MSLTEEIPTPRKLTDTSSAFKAADARARGVAWVYYARTDTLLWAEYLPWDQALEVAQSIARVLP